MKEKSLKNNAVLNIIRTIMGVIFPLITYPYISRILGVENLGKIDFSSSIISYFSLLAAFGVSTYAVREVSKVRDNKEECSRVSNEIFTINVLMTCVSYIVFFLVLLVSIKMHDYLMLLIIQSVSILFTTIGVEWVNIVYEDFFYITIRSVLFQILSILFMFLFVKNEGDLYSYSIIMLFSSSAGNLLNSIYCRKYVKVHIVKDFKMNIHFKPMLMLFFANITTIIFVSSDQTMMGYFLGDYYVGIYSLAVKVYTIAKRIFTALLIVVVPRISATKSEEQSTELGSRVFDILLMILLPMAVGMFCVSDGIVSIIGGSAFIEAVSTIKVLSLALICAGMAGFVTYIFVVPRGKDRILLVASSCSAGLNIVLNLFMIPVFKNNGAAWTTAISELCVVIIEIVALKVKFKISFNNIKYYCLGCLIIFAVCYGLDIMLPNLLINTFASIILSIFSYVIVLICGKNRYAIVVLNKFKNKIQ